MVHSSKEAAFRATYLPNQQWTLPDSLVYYITKNPLSGKLYEKMIRSCKHFFIEKPLLIIPRLLMLHCSTENSITDKWHAFLDDDERYDFENMPLKCWITEYFDVQYYIYHNCNFISEFIPKIYQCDAKELKLSGQRISINELIFLGSKCVKIYLDECILLNEDGSVIKLEKLVGIFPKVKNFCYIGELLNKISNIIITSKTVQKLIKIPNFQNLENFELCGIPETFDIEMFFDYMKKNKKTKMQLFFNEFISEAYKIRLQAIVDEILATKNPTYKLPWINFSGVNEVYDQKMSELYR